MNLIVDIVLAMAAITALTVAVWIYLDKPVRSYSIAAFIWLFLVTIVFALSAISFPASSWRLSLSSW
jgi:RsiW-degrading membrane proteinase PrsW (M82 family)